MSTSNPKLLNLDDLETPQSDIGIIHQGTEHKMRVLTVEAFIEQQKRAAETQRRAEEAGSVGDDDVVAVVELIRDSIKEFFPTLPVNEMETQKLFAIFAWLNEMSEKINEAGAPDEGEGVSTEGNVQEKVES